MSKNPLDLFRLDGRVALVTGGAGGLGIAMCETLIGAGARVIMADLDGNALQQASASLNASGLQVETRSLDVTNEGHVDATIASIGADAGRLDILVNCAGIGARVASTEVEKTRWDKVMEVNVNGTFLPARAAARLMLPARHGSIINLASMMGMVGGNLYPNAAYHASKGAVVNLTRGLAIEWAPHNVRVNAIAPCFIKTPLTAKLLEDEAIAKAVLDLTPLGRFATAEEIAAAVLYLASDAAAMVTGHVLAVDGGWLAQ